MHIKSIVVFFIVVVVSAVSEMVTNLFIYEMCIYDLGFVKTRCLNARSAFSIQQPRLSSTFCNPLASGDQPRSYTPLRPA